MDLGRMRFLLRERLEVEQEDWPDALIDASIGDAYRRVLGMSSRWPWLETIHTETIPGGEGSLSAEQLGGVRDVMALTVGGRQLRFDDEQHLSARFGHQGVPQAWSQFAGHVRLWPTPAGDTEIQVRGWRAPLPFVAQSGWEPDLPDGFETLLLDWAMADEYQRQDDMEMAMAHREKFENQAAALRRSTEARPTVTPIVMNSRR